MEWMVHEKIDTTDSYIGQATDYYNCMPVNWISLALKPCQKHIGMTGKRDKIKIDRMPFLGLLTEFSPVDNNGPGEIYTGLQERFSALECRFLTYRFFIDIKSFFLKTFFFLYLFNIILK